MKNKLILILLIGIVLISFISANDLKISLKPHFFKNGVEILPTPEIQYSAISFEVIGENFNQKYRLLNLSIIDAYPQEFKKSLPLDMKENLRILQTRTLWVSQLINIKDLIQNNQTNISLWDGVEGINEGTGENVYAEGHLSFTINRLEESIGIIQHFGNIIWEDNPTGGILIGFVAIFGIGFAYWKYRGSDKLNNWRDNTEKRRRNIRRYEEGY